MEKKDLHKRSDSIFDKIESFVKKLKKYQKLLRILVQALITFEILG